MTEGVRGAGPQTTRATYSPEGMLQGAHGRQVFDDDVGYLRCTADSKQTGDRCKRRIAAGFITCVMHGSGTRAAIRAARLRLVSLLEPALAQHARILARSDVSDNDRLRAIQMVYDRVGLPPGIEVTFEDAREMLHDRVEELLTKRDGGETARLPAMARPPAASVN